MPRSTQVYTDLQTLSVSAFEKTRLSCALQADNSGIEPPTDVNQLILFDLYRTVVNSCSFSRLTSIH